LLLKGQHNKHASFITTVFFREDWLFSTLVKHTGAICKLM